MNAVATALEVLAWAAAPSGPPPQGPLRDTDQLLRSGSRLAPALQQLVAVTSARLRLGCPPLGDDRPLTPAPAVLAAILGGYGILDANLAQVLIGQIVGPASSMSDCVARHGLVAPALPHLPEELREEYRRASPLTGLLDRPAEGAKAEALSVASRLHTSAAGRRCLALALAEPSEVVEVMLWRGELLNRFRGAPGGKGLAFVLDVYEAAMTYHADAALAQVRTAVAVLDDPNAMSNDAELGLALAVAGWWGPLDALGRAHPAELRARRYLPYDHRKGIALFQRAKALS